MINEMNNYSVYFCGYNYYFLEDGEVKKQVNVNVAQDVEAAPYFKANHLFTDKISPLEGDTVEIENLKANNLVDLIYPIGSIYWTENASINPNTTFGGTWKQIKDRFILAAGDTYTNGEVGGEAEHTLTEDEMPKHNHTGFTDDANISFTTSWFQTDYGFKGGGYENMTVETRGGNTDSGDGHDVCGRNTYNASHSHSIQPSGENAAHNNMPPYEVAFCWKRVS